MEAVVVVRNAGTNYSVICNEVR